MSEEPERQAEDMEERSKRLEREIEETRSDWESKKADVTAPGAQPDDDEEHDDDGPPPEADITPGD
jgi:hypothetical protein